jgi:hypothetical protein
MPSKANDSPLSRRKARNQPVANAITVNAWPSSDNNDLSQCSL